MAVDGLALDHERDVAELRLVEDVEEVPLIGGAEHGVEGLCVQGLAEIELADPCVLHLILLLRGAACLRSCVDSATLSICQLWIVLKDAAHVLVLLVHSARSGPDVGVV